MSTTKKIAISGAAGNIAYQACFRIAAGELLGIDQTIDLQLLDIEAMLPKAIGVKMELNDCAFPLLNSVNVTADPNIAFSDADYIFLFGAKPRTKGMERKDLLEENGKIFGPQGKAINSNASREVRVLVIGNPANTNCLIAATNAPEVNPNQFTSMMRLDHDRAKYQLAKKAGKTIASIQKMTVWGNHSSTQFPDISSTIIDGEAAKGLIDNNWYEKEFIPTIQQRGAAIINARGASSAASAANAAIAHMRDWIFGTKKDDWTSMGLLSVGNYDIASDIYFSFPVLCQDSNFTVVDNLEHSEFARSMLNATQSELLEERDAVKDLLG
jgi:malate dehydrogenase